MISNYFKTSFRFIKKRWRLTVLNIAGYGIGIAACILILQDILYETSYDTFYPNYENIYRVKLDHYYPYDVYQNSTAISFAPVGPELKNQYPEIKEFVRVSRRNQNVLVTYKENVFREDALYFVDSSFFKVFSVDLIEGKESALQWNDILISESTAMKFFGKKNAVGELVDVWGYSFAVKGVYRDVPEAAHFRYDMLFLIQPNNNLLENWQHYNYYTYVLLHENTDRAALEQKLKAFSEKYSKFSDDQSSAEYRWELTLQPLKSIHLESHMDFEHEVNGSMQNVVIIFFVAILIIAISCFNYVNLSNAMYSDRLREFFVRKVHGATSSNLLKQYVFESLLLTVLGFAFAIVITVVFTIQRGQLDKFNWNEPVLYYSLFGILLISIVFSGVFPALVFSFFNPLRFLKGEYAVNSSKGGLGKFLIVLQFSISFVLIAGALTIDRQLAFVSRQYLGFDNNAVVVLDFPALRYSQNQGDLRKLKNDLENNPAIEAVSFAESVPGTTHINDASLRLVEDPAENAKLCYNQLVSPEYFSTYKIDIVAGRVFSEDQPGDLQTLLINEVLARQLNVKHYKDLIGRRVSVPWQGDYAVFEIIGIIKDYHHESVKNAIQPCLFIPLQNGGFCNKASIRVSSGTPGANDKVIAEIESAYKKIFPYPFQFAYAADLYNKQYATDAQFSYLIGAFAILAIFMASIGFFGLASNDTRRRTREVAIRKIHGARVDDVYILFARHFMKLVGFAFVLALPVSFFIARNWLNNFVVRVDMGLWFVAWPVLITTALSLVSVSYYVLKVALLRPVAVLREGK